MFLNVCCSEESVVWHGYLAQKMRSCECLKKKKNTTTFIITHHHFTLLISKKNLNYQKTKKKSKILIGCNQCTHQVKLVWL